MNETERNTRRIDRLELFHEVTTGGPLEDVDATDPPVGRPDEVEGRPVGPPIYNVDVAGGVLLGGGVEQRHSPNQGGKVGIRTGIVIHATAGRSFRHTTNWFERDDSDVSAHLLISRDPSEGIRQFVAFDERAWHAGKGRYAGKRSANGWTVGIELDSPLKLKEDGKDRWGALFYARTGFKDVVGWATYPEAQIVECARVVRALADAYPIEDVFGHEHYKATKSDPGPAFPWDKLREMVDLPELKYPTP